MGTTSTRRSLEELQAEYEALDNKRSREGVALRKAMAEAKAPEPEADEAVTPFALDDKAETVSVSSGSDETVVIDQWAIKPPEFDEDGILPDLGSLRTSERTAVYWMGVIPGDAETGEGVPPLHQFDGIGGGVGFYEYETPHEGKGQDGSHRRGQHMGYLTTMSETQVAQLREGLRSSVVRWRVRKGRHKHGYVMHIPSLKTLEETKERLGLKPVDIERAKVRAAMFQLEPGDEPVARYIYCVKVDGPEAKAGGKWRPSTTLPPSVEKIGAIEGP